MKTAHLNDEIYKNSFMCCLHRRFVVNFFKHNINFYVLLQLFMLGSPHNPPQMQLSSSNFFFLDFFDKNLTLIFIFFYKILVSALVSVLNVNDAFLEK